MVRYHPLEERINVISHGVGAVLGVIAFVLLVYRAVQLGDFMHLIGFGVFGLSLVVLYTASTLYHYATDTGWRKRLRKLDHAAIYVLIAGSYTPFALITLRHADGWLVFSTVWVLALIGMVLKLYFTGRYDKLSTAMYLGMGWMAMLYVKPLMQHLPADGLYWLLGGGIAYTAGAVLYSIRRIRFNHAIFHFFVLAGSFSHFVTVFFYVLPKPGA